MEGLLILWQGTGLANFQIGQLVMIFVGCVLLYLAIRKGFEPLLLLPIGFGAILANIPEVGLANNAIQNALYAASPDVMGEFARILGLGSANPEAIKVAVDGANLHQLKELDEAAHAAKFADGTLYSFYNVAIASGIAPLLIFMGVGAMTDFGALIANPRTLWLGAAAQFGIFATLFGAILLNLIPGMEFSLADAASIAIIGGADGPTAIFLASKLSPDLLGAIAVAAYSYMALVPIIQPPIMKLFTSEEERKIEMKQLRHVSKTEKIIFPLAVLVMAIIFLPSATPLVGMFCLGNLMRESGVVDRLSNTAQNELINIVTIFLGLSVGSKLQADQFLHLETLGILVLGAVAFSIGTAAGVLMAKLLNKYSKDNINPLIGAAGVSAVPMAARVVNKVGLDSNPQNFLLMHAMGPNVAGVLGSAVAAGVLLALVG
ncbi:oxaloacetate decarboxylase subunit beta [Enterovibrio norvegicus]|uniref:Oxaloacetate decarboxylase beta chain n=1 Tax=Enterovibrio norvegicus DSM 15893 TaxID=1121869 RepID=A0A1I5U6H5_9GAMM|nr:sodium ion-translocating decarboxylase subunit beta [Enterovibrio norvegicus]MCC4800928.1 sodium ion-translocating decarboxylase subunit beta [Enterovibrio norvegicus]OEF51141.1 oxaloacetate decarboxylase subunit beta [Enterovibrio norvegicus]PMH59407.1 oxaloacetate decarboxylase subunit beta [Enterovibrio norvegicus]PMI30874.1 oxaloacetate decarboxylase subunit beta [Enterovibrio norvegicus]PMI35187.1 oxaloacetate decarboxylase subunit beta [Enterovibrio norvegicus]